MLLRRAFLRFLAGYLLLLLVPLLSGIAITNRLVEEYEVKVVASRIGQLEQARDVIESFVEDLEWRIYRIAGNTSLQRYLVEEKGNEREVRLIQKDIVEDLNSMLLYDSSLVSVFYVHAFGDDMILTPNSVYSGGDFVDDKTFFRMEGVAATDWHRIVRGSYQSGRFYPVRLVTLEDFKNKAMIPYVRSLPLVYRETDDSPPGAVVYFIGEDEFSGLLAHIDLPDGGYIYIADEENTILTSRQTGLGGTSIALPDGQSSGAFRIRNRNADDQFVTYVVSQDSGWRFVSVLPIPWVFQGVRILQAISYGALVLALLLSVGLSAWMAWRRTENLDRLFGLIRSDEDAESPLDIGDLNAGVSRLVRNNDELTEELRNQKQFVFGNFISRLLSGYYRNEETIEGFRAYLGINEDYRWSSSVAVFLGRKGNSDNVAVFHDQVTDKAVAISELRSLFSGTLWTTDFDEDLLACVFHSDRSDGERHLQEVSGILHDWMKQRGVSSFYDIHIGLGEPSEGLLGIHQSWMQAREAGEYAVRNHQEIVQFDQVERVLDSGYYPIELEIRLLNSVRGGDADALMDVFTVISDENLRKRNLPRNEQIRLLSEVRSSLVKVRSRYGSDGDEVRVEEADLKKGLESLQERFLAICLEVDRKKKSHNSELIRRIESYLGENFRDRNLCLASVSQEYAISESYLSYFFREQTGEKFSVRVESLRISEAERLLQETGLAISAVAEQVGYNSDKTFRRVFRRLKGMSPNEYRLDLNLNRII